MLFGRSPFKRPTRPEIDWAICNDPVNFPGDPDWLPPEGRDFILARAAALSPVSPRLAAAHCAFPEPVS